MSAALSPTFPTTLSTVTLKFFSWVIWTHFYWCFSQQQFYVSCVDRILKTGFAADSRQNREKTDIFKPFRFEPLYQRNFGFWFFAWSKCGRIVKKVLEKIPGAKITWFYLRRHLHCVISSHRHLCPKPPKKFERKLCRFWLKEPLIKT